MNYLVCDNCGRVITADIQHINLRLPILDVNRNRTAMDFDVCKWCAYEIGNELYKNHLKIKVKSKKEE